MTLQVLVTTMHQNDLSIYKDMNLQSDAIIANQADTFAYQEEKIDGHTVQMFTTPTRGTSRNRNIAVSVSTADYILFSDDDLVFNDGYEQLILEEFERHTEAEAIKFNLHDLSSTRKLSMRRIENFEKATRSNMAASGVCGLVIRSSILKRDNLHFHEYFGPGLENYCGEDTIFLQQIIRNKIKFYRSPIDIAGIDQTESTWFDGKFGEKKFTVNGKVLATIYPNLCYFIAFRSAYRFYKRHNSSLSFREILKCYIKGILEIKHG